MEKKNVGLQKKLSATLSHTTISVEEFKQKLKDAAENLKASQLNVQRLQQQCKNTTAYKERAVENAKSESKSHSLLYKGVYTEKSRSLM
jgi:regulator of replication initiation timing